MMKVIITNLSSEDLTFNMNENIRAFGTPINITKQEFDILSSMMFINKDKRKEKSFLIQRVPDTMIPEEPTPEAEDAGHGPQDEEVATSRSASADDFLVGVMEEEINIFEAINSQVDSEEVAIAIYNQVAYRTNNFSKQWGS